MSCNHNRCTFLREVTNLGLINLLSHLTNILYLTFPVTLQAYKWPKIVSIVELDPQAMLTIRLPILSKNIIHYDVR